MGNSISTTDISSTTSVDLTNSQYAAKQRKLLEYARILREKNGKDLFKTPNIAVIGKQSSGKSSLFEAISGVRVPRDLGTCTRCPIECNVISSPSPTAWTCTIKLRLDYDPNTNLPLPTPRVIPFGSPITDPDSVEGMLRKAMEAVLAWPERRVEEFLQDGTEPSRLGSGSSGARMFTKNIVCVDVQCESGSDITFADLPGLVSYMPEMPGAVELVEEMVREYIRDDCIILVTVPMADDIENQKALQIAREADPLGQRTVVVLTKPDELLLSGSGTPDSVIRNTWRKALNGELHPLKLGYYCVKLASERERLASKALKKSHKHQHEAERRYFASGKHPLVGLNNPGRLGVENLVADLARWLMGMLDEALPKLKRSNYHQIVNLEQRLARFHPLTEMLDAPYASVVHHVTALVRVLQEYVNDCEGKQELIQQNDAVFESFANKIKGTEPIFVPWDRDTDGDGEAKEVKDLSPEMDVYDIRRELRAQSGRGLPDSVSNRAIRRLTIVMTDSWPRHVQECFDKCAKKLEDCLKREIGDRFDEVPRLKDAVLALAMEHFKVTVKQAKTAVSATLELERKGTFTRNREMYNRLRDEWEQTHINVDYANSLVSRTAASEGDGYGERQATDSDNMNNADDPPRTEWNDGADDADLRTPIATTAHENVKEYAEAQKQIKRVWKEKGVAMGARELTAFESYQSSPEIALAELAAGGIERLSRAHLKQLYPSKDFTEEKKLMARMHAYFGVMQTRVIDNIPSAIDIHLNQGFVSSIQDALMKGILDRPSTKIEDVIGLLSEKPELSKKRAEDMTMLRRLKEMQDELQRFNL